MGNSNVTDVVTQDAKREKPLVLCLHGWRTSGRILSMQTAALRYHTDIECKFIDAPFEASGPPDQGIATFYSSEDYCEWYTTNSTNYHACLLHSLSVLIKYINENGPFDAVLGFSQGAAMATRLALLQQENDHRLNRSCYFKYLVLIGGVIPKELNDSELILNLPSLHIMGTVDEYLAESRRLTQLYNTTLIKILIHNEGHNIPSIRTELYPLIREWIYEQHS